MSDLTAITTPFGLRSENPTQGFEGWRVTRMVEVLE